MFNYLILYFVSYKVSAACFWASKKTAAARSASTVTHDVSIKHCVTNIAVKSLALIREFID